jgi:hypothetical protein
MCNADAFKFCTCSSRIDKFQNYWELHREKPEGPLVIIGMLPYNWKQNALQRDWGQEVLNMLRNPGAFDFDYAPQEGDRLTLYIRNPMDLVFREDANLLDEKDKSKIKKVLIQFTYFEDEWELENCEDESLSLNHDRLRKGVICERGV